MKSLAAGHTDYLNVQAYGRTEREAMPAGSILGDEETLRKLLRVAHRKVCSKASSRTSGSDGMRKSAFQADSDRIISSAAESLMSGKYYPSPLKTVNIPKSSGGHRQIAIPTLTDRMIQSMIRGEIEVAMEPVFYDAVHGFRPNRGIHTALMAFRAMIKAGKPYVLQMDIQKMFDSIDVRRLLNLLGHHHIDVGLIRAVQASICCRNINGRELNPRDNGSPKGVPQGSPLSPLLANVYMHELDRIAAGKGYQYIRYADDCTVVLGSSDALKRAEWTIIGGAGAIGLSINVAKTCRTDIRRKPVNILGLDVDRHGKVSIPEAKVAEVMERIEQKTYAAGQNRISPKTATAATYEYVKGIMSYYSIIDDYEPLLRIKEFAKQILKLTEEELYEYRYII